MKTTAKMFTKIFLLFVLCHTANGCTEFFLKSVDGGVCVGRSMEYAVDLKSNIKIEPRLTMKKLNAPVFCGQRKYSYKSKYDVAIIDGLERPISSDGMNSRGLSVGALMLPGFTKYDTFTVKDCGSNAVSNLQLVQWILDNFKSTAEVRKYLKLNMFPKVWGKKIKNILFELHYTVTDSTGDALVIEFTKEGRKYHDNKVHVVTNAPTYDFHMLNLKNYVHLTKYSRPDLKLGNVTITPVGVGSGLLGVPGDFTPPSRFIRTAALVHFSTPPKTINHASNLAFHILNSVDIPKGVAAMKPEDRLSDYTQWIVVKDLKNARLYIRGYDDLSIRMVDLNKIKHHKIVSMPIERSFHEGVVEVTNDMYRKINNVGSWY